MISRRDRSMKPRIHLLSLAHQVLTENTPHCAYTAKIFNMSKMLAGQSGFDVSIYHAGSDVSKVDGHEYVQVVQDSLMSRVYGENFASTFNTTWNQDDPCWKEFCRNAKSMILERVSGFGDIVFVSFGNAHYDAVPDTSLCIPIEMGIGYSGIAFPNRIWESYAWKHYCMALYPGMFSLNSFDVVIPGYFDPVDFSFSEKKGDYFLFMARAVREKGLIDAARACRAAGVKLIVAGEIDRDMRSTVKGLVSDAVIMGPVGKSERRDLLSGAKATFCLTHYVEPFGNVAVESMYSGTPVISTDHGAFVETVVHGVSGFRCINLERVVSAMTRIVNGEIDPYKCREKVSRFTLKEVWPLYEKALHVCRELRIKDLHLL